MLCKQDIFLDCEYYIFIFNIIRLRNLSRGMRLSLELLAETVKKIVLDKPFIEEDTHTGSKVKR